MAYLGTWQRFNDFLFKLDRKPDLWEDRASLFIAYLDDKGVQSNTIKSYISAIKTTLIHDNYKWQDNRILLNILTRGCRVINDRVRTRLPIGCGLLELLLFEVKREFGDSQPYLETMYLALFALSYYGLFRVGEVCASDHSIKASNVQIALNKEKILIILHSSKTHHEGMQPQKVKITSNKSEQTGSYRKCHFCPFKLMQNYLKM